MTQEEIVQEIVENGRATDQTELENEFSFTASEDGWSDEKIREAIDSPWFPTIE